MKGVLNLGNHRAHIEISPEEITDSTRLLFRELQHREVVYV